MIFDLRVYVTFLLTRAFIRPHARPAPTALWPDLISCHTISYTVKILACTSTSSVPKYSYFRLMLTCSGFRPIFKSMIYNPIPEDSGVRWNSYLEVLYLNMSTNSWGLFQKITSFQDCSSKLTIQKHTCKPRI